MTISLVNAADYHVPQDRQRVMIVGIRSDLVKKYGVSFAVPNPFPDRVSMRDALSGFGTPDPRDVCSAPYSSRYMSRNRRRRWDDVSYTIPAMAKQVPLWPGSPGMVKIGQDRWEFGTGGVTRRFSWQEAAAIQTFPAGMEFAGDLTSKYRQIGNAVPCELARNVGLVLYDILSCVA